MGVTGVVTSFIVFYSVLLVLMMLNKKRKLFEPEMCRIDYASNSLSS